jgi:hypothetical protein
MPYLNPITYTAIMKNPIHFLALLGLAYTATFTACVSAKKSQASKTNTEVLKNNNSEVNRKLSEEATPAKKVKKPTAEYTPKSAENLSPLPPAEVAGVFKSSYPTATQVTWAKETPSPKLENSSNPDYKASFTLRDKRNSAIYTEKGELVETREQILPDQLPKNVHDAITNRHPDVRIMSASTFKNSNMKGSYTAIILLPAAPEEKELILMDNGTFVE